MDELFTDKDVNARVRRILQYKARRLDGSAGYTKQDTDDIVEDVLLHLLEHPLAFDADRGDGLGLICRVADRKIANLVASRRAAKRNHGVQPLSLNEPVGTEPDSPQTLEGTYDMDTYLNLTGKRTRSAVELQDLRLDVERFLQSLPEDLRLIAVLLQHHRKSEAARLLGIPWGTFCDRCRELRHRMKQWKLDEYTKTSGKTRSDPVPRQ